MNTPSPYPSLVATYTVKVNHIDVYNDDHINKLQNDVIALQTYIGTNPHGNKAELTTRIAQMMATNGAIAQGVAFPTGPVEGQEFWRTDLTTLYVYGNSAWNAQGQSFSNYLFQYAGALQPSSVKGEVTASSYLDSTTAPKMRYLRNGNAAAFGTVWESVFKKVSGINTVTIKALVWVDSGVSGVGAALRISIGSVTAIGLGTTFRTTPELITFSLDVSGLGANTFYNVTADLAPTNTTGNAFCGNIIGFGS